MSIKDFEMKFLKAVPVIKAGDTIRVSQKIKEGDKERVSKFEGLVISLKHGNGLNGMITVRKVVDGIGVERIFPLHATSINSIEVLKNSKVRRAKLYYVREKAAREIRKKMKSVTREIGIINRPIVKQKKTAEEEKVLVEEEQIS